MVSSFFLMDFFSSIIKLFILEGWCECMWLNVLDIYDKDNFSG